MIEMDFVVRSASRGQVEEPAAALFPANFELMNDGTGETILMGMLLPAIQKVR